MTDSDPRSTEALKREASADGGSLFATMRGLWPYIWPTGPPRPAVAGRLVAMVLLLVAKLATIAVPFTFKWATDALVGEGSAPVAPSSWLVWVFAAPILMTVAYGGTRILMAVLTQIARRRLRQGGDECGAPARLPHLRAHAPALAALPSGAQDRRADPRAGARPQRHRDHRAHGDHAARADHHRARADRRRAALSVRLALRGGRSRSWSPATWCSPIWRPNGASTSAAG